MTPVTLLSGFLGAGKTTLLRRVLEGGELGRVGCVVNDVAAVNIDAKLVRRTGRTAGAAVAGGAAADFDSVELDNGCVCCSAGDDLFQAIAKLLGVAKRRGYAYSRIVVEGSGVAEPKNLRDNFQEASLLKLPLMRRVHMDHMVTVVDSGAFFKTLQSTERLKERPDLGSGGGRQPVADLLMEQVEFADVVVLNKADTLDNADMVKLEAIVSSLNPLARIVSATFGDAPLWSLYGDPNNKAPMAKLTVEGQVRGAVAAAKHKHGHDHVHRHSHEEGHAHSHGDGHTHSHGDGHTHSHGDGHAHSHGHGHAHSHGDCHAHSHGDGHAHSQEDGHAHSHGDGHVHGPGCGHDHAHTQEDGHVHGPGCGHDHAHAQEDGHVHGPGCGHDHSHDHDHDHSHPQETTAAIRFGIRSFVYSARKPFNMDRLKNFSKEHFGATVMSNTANKDGNCASKDSPIRNVLRSKGFVWLASTHGCAWYWSHAASAFEIVDEGDWWSAIPDEEWPELQDQRQALLADFAGPWGDRRQEIVFIGIDMDEPAIVALLDQCLCSDAEMDKYTDDSKLDPDPEHTDTWPGKA